MLSINLNQGARGAAALLLASASPVLAGQYQTPYQTPNQTPFQTMPGPTPDADALAANMRILGANPVDLPALLDAADLTLKLGDIDASAAFLARAERISPADGRIKAGQARALVQLGRPGEALRRFGDAERLGYPIDNLAAERALAYDLIGEQDRAQRDYRRVLKIGPNDETLRRYALSLGISGKRDQALEQIDALVRRSDRAAWRVRAFILAMSGDVSGAERIATGMLPGAMASGLMPFFRILPTLGPADRAFAVHFGEVRPTPERIADARLVPPLPTLAPEPAPPVQVAVTLPVLNDRRGRNRRDRAKPVQVAVVTPPPAIKPQLPPPPKVAMLTPMPAVPPLQPDRIASAAPGLTPSRQPIPVPTRDKAQVTLARADLPPTPTPRREPPVPVPVPVLKVPAAPAVAALAPPRPIASEDSILARIVAGIGVPAEELGVGPVAPPPVVAARAAPVAGVREAKPAAPIDTKAAAKKAAADKVADRAAAKAAAEQKLADKKLADEKAAKAKALKSAPPRVWVQVAGGANVRDLPKAWAKLAEKAPAMFKGRSAYTTPLRFTNRLLAGPFKTEDEAQGFVNQIAKSGLTGFVFTSEAGQKIDKLPSK